MGMIAHQNSEEVSESRMLWNAGISVWKLPPQVPFFPPNLQVWLYMKQNVGHGLWSHFCCLGTGEQLWPDVVHWGAICDHSCKFTISYSRWVKQNVRLHTVCVLGGSVGWVKEGYCVRLSKIIIYRWLYRSKMRNQKKKKIKWNHVPLRVGKI